MKVIINLPTILVKKTIKLSKKNNETITQTIVNNIKLGQFIRNEEENGTKIIVKKESIMHFL